MAGASIDNGDSKELLKVLLGLDDIQRKCRDFGQSTPA